MEANSRRVAHILQGIFRFLDGTEILHTEVFIVAIVGQGIVKVDANSWDSNGGSVSGWNMTRNPSCQGGGSHPAKWFF